MKYNEKWLSEWVRPEIEADALLEQLTMAGLEVDGTTPVAGDFHGVVVGRVLAASPHPNADKLSVCQVDDGEGTHQVVCGAPNVRAGLTTAFARVGSVLPGDFRIRKAKLRDVVSHGMLCSAAELGLGEDHDGILELADDLVPGSDLRQALDLDDRIVDLELTPNRGDCLSIRGLAREVGVLNNTPVTVPAISPTAAGCEDTFEVRLDDEDGCPRYLGRVIRGVDITRPSPPWLRERLRRVGVRSIDAVVDVTNLVMMELGQPMHAFDLDRLAAPIVVRRSKPGERLTLLDGREVTFDDSTLLITDANGPVAIAGVMGGERSGTQTDTRDVFLECAFFHPLAVAGTARKYGLQTDASHRYERGVDYELQQLAMDRATALLLEIVGGKPGPVTEAVAPAHLPVPAEVILREGRLNALLGVTIDPAEVDEALERLGFERLDRSAEAGGVRWTIRAPSHRFDIAREADLVEEICRIYGYNNVPSRRPVTDLALRQVPLDASSVPALKQQLVDAGYQEVITYSFIDPRMQDLLAPGMTPLTLENPMSLEQSVMRTSLFPSLVEALRANVSRQQDRVRLFEVGRCFHAGDPVRQPVMLGMVLWGRRDPENWALPGASVDFFDLKGDLERVLAWTGQKAGFERLADPVLHPGQAAALIVGGQRVGRFGRLHPEFEQRLDMPGEIFLAEVEAQAVLAQARRWHGTVSRFPSVRRDLAIVVDRSVAAGEIVKLLEESLDEVLVDLRLFDVYQGKGIDSTEKSLGIGLTLQKPSATLTEEEIGQYMQAAIEALAKEAGARLR
ncbi:MAG: phenylalanine--tRNA ligase subunit beta [Pseudomonadales bacterium]